MGLKGSVAMMRSVRRARWAPKWRVQINFDDSDGDCGFEAVATVARRGMRSRVEWGCMEGEARSLVNASQGTWWRSAAKSDLKDEHTQSLTRISCTRRPTDTNTKAAYSPWLYESLSSCGRSVGKCRA